MRKINEIFYSLQGEGYHTGTPAIFVRFSGCTELTHVSGDVVDMEAYAQAFVCRSKEIPFISVKYVTDIIGQNSVKHWEDKLADARQGLSHYFNVLKERI